MIQRTGKAHLLGAAITALLTVALSGFSGLVLCIGADGHRALEVEHASIACPTQNTLGSGAEASLQRSAKAECLDLPATGSNPVLPSKDADHLSIPAASLLAALPKPAPRIDTRFSVATAARAGPSPLARVLASTVLLV